MNEPCRTHVTESCRTYEWVTSHMWKSRVAHVMPQSLSTFQQQMNPILSGWFAERDLHEKAESFKCNYYIISLWAIINAIIILWVYATLHRRRLRHEAETSVVGETMEFVSRQVWRNTTHCNTLQRSATRCKTLNQQGPAPSVYRRSRCGGREDGLCLQVASNIRVAVCCSVLQCVAVCCSVLQWWG